MATGEVGKGEVRGRRGREEEDSHVAGLMHAWVCPSGILMFICIAKV